MEGKHTKLRESSKKKNNKNESGNCGHGEWGKGEENKTKFHSLKRSTKVTKF